MIEHTLPSKTRLSKRDLSDVLWDIAEVLTLSSAPPKKEAVLTFDVDYDGKGNLKHILNHVKYTPKDFDSNEHGMVSVSTTCNLHRHAERVFIIPRSAEAAEQLNGFQAITRDGRVYARHNYHSVPERRRQVYTVSE